MTLTIGPAPLGTKPPDEANYTIDGPAHRLLLTPFPRRVRAALGAATVFDTERGQLLHESNLLPVLYVPEADVDASLLERTDHTTHCPFKGDAAYWTVRSGDRRAENAMWAYPEPVESASWLAGLVAFSFDRLDHWYDEDEEVFAHLRDPYHRVDVRPSRRRVIVRVGDEEVADSTAAMVLSENGLPNRWYLPPTDVRTDRLERSSTVTRCAYKGRAAYWNLTPTAGRPGAADVAWSYPEPLNDAARVQGCFCFSGDDVAIEVAPAG